MKKKSFLIFLLPFILVISSCLLIGIYTYQNRKISEPVEADKEIFDNYFSSYQFEYDLLSFCYNIDYNSQSDINFSFENNIKKHYGENLNSDFVNEISAFLLNTGEKLRNEYNFLSYYLPYPDKENDGYGNHGYIHYGNETMYYFTIKIHFDDSGNVSLESTNNFDIPIKNVYNNLVNDQFNYYISENEIENANLIKNRDFYFAINKNVNMTDALSAVNVYYTYTPQDDTSDHIPAILFSFIILGLIALCIPIKKLSEWNFYQTVFEIPLEINILISIIFLWLTCSYIFRSLFYKNALAAMLYCILAFIFILDVLIFKYFILYPPIKYFKERTLLGNSFHYIIANMKQFDLTDSYNFTILKIVLVNAVFITLLPIIFGIKGLIIYSILLFIILINLANRVKDDYQSLLNVTSSIASGEFDTSIDTDLGVFNSYKNSMNSIRDDFKKAVENEIKSEKLKSELITSVSHDLKTPLTSIVTYADLLKNNQLEENKRNEYIEVIDRNAIRLKNLINDLFEVSKATSGNVTLSFIEIDIISLIKQVLFEYEHLLEKKNLEIKFTCDPEKILLNLDSQKTYRIFTNLIVNISKYALENTRVYIDIKEIDREVIIIMKNISKNEIQVKASDLFERFVQGDSSRHSEGSGLGLAIVKTFTELQHGKCQIEVDGDLFKVILIFKK